ncbi:MAG: CehA/McbA family metallohydrolase [Firmicutes bacterium]|nr:CehA/McbA family metallohydrolase [Bacillota bacterium]
MNPKHVLAKALLVVAILFVFPACLWAETSLPMDQLSVRKGVQQIIQVIDSAAFSSQMATEEFMVKAFMILKGRKPDAFEFYYYQKLTVQSQLKRSQLLALLLADTEGISWDACRTLLRSNMIGKLNSMAGIKQEVEAMKQASGADVIKAYQKRLQLNQTTSANTETLSFAAPQAMSTPTLAAAVPYDTYNTYFGFLHAHTSFSDGKGTPQEAYAYARNTGKLDFFAVTDHGEQLIYWPWENKWSKIKSAANAAYVPGTFVALWGFEWSNPLNGHVNVIGTNDYTNCISNVGIGDLYNWLNARPEGFAFFNHPGEYDSIGIEFMHLDITDTQVIAKMVGIENWNSNNGFDKYYYQGSWSYSYSYWDVGNQKGWYLGSLGNQDNHDRNWGTMNQFRTAVLAKSLTREEITAAYLARRFYATEDNDLVLDFRCQGYPMGSQLTGVSRYFTVNASDQSGDTFAEIRLYRNGNLIAVQPVVGNSVSAVFTDYNTTSKAYYFVIVRQNDDNNGNGRNDEAISSPIWIR